MNDNHCNPEPAKPDHARRTAYALDQLDDAAERAIVEAEIAAKPIRQRTVQKTQAIADCVERALRQGDGEEPSSELRDAILSRLSTTTEPLPAIALASTAGNADPDRSLCRGFLRSRRVRAAALAASVLLVFGSVAYWGFGSRRAGSAALVAVDAGSLGDSGLLAMASADGTPSSTGASADPGTPLAAHSAASDDARKTGPSGPHKGDASPTVAAMTPSHVSPAVGAASAAASSPATTPATTPAATPAATIAASGAKADPLSASRTSSQNNTAAMPGNASAVEANAAAPQAIPSALANPREVAVAEDAMASGDSGSPSQERTPGTPSGKLAASSSKTVDVEDPTADVLSKSTAKSSSTLPRPDAEVKPSASHPARPSLAGASEKRWHGNTRNDDDLFPRMSHDSGRVHASLPAEIPESAGVGAAGRGGSNSREQALRTRQGFCSVAKHPVSRFPLPGHSGSYAEARDSLRRGLLPPAEAVRIEEFANQFHGDGPKPADREPFALQVELAQCPWQPAHQLARITLRISAAQSVRARSSIAASDLRIRVEFNPVMVDQYRLLGFEPVAMNDERTPGSRSTSRDAVVGDVFTMVYEIAAKPGRSPVIEETTPQPPLKQALVFGHAMARSGVWFTVQTRYPTARGEWAESSPIPVVGPGGAFAKTSHDFQCAVAATAFAMLLHKTPDIGSLTFKQVEPWAAAVGDGRQDRMELIELIQAAEKASRR
jgi:hypothetical protein